MKKFTCTIIILVLSVTSFSYDPSGMDSGADYESYHGYGTRGHDDWSLFWMIASIPIMLIGLVLSQLIFGIFYGLFYIIFKIIFWIIIYPILCIYSFFSNDDHVPIKSINDNKKEEKSDESFAVIKSDVNTIIAEMEYNDIIPQDALRNKTLLTPSKGIAPTNTCKSLSMPRRRNVEINKYSNESLIDSIPGRSDIETN